MPPSSNAKVVILCGGQGTRMREETEYRPKPMVEVGGRPLLWHIMKIYAAAGLTDFVCCLGYRGAMIKQYFLEYRSLAADVSVNLRSGDVEYHSSESEDWNVTLVDTGDDSMTGARVKRVAHHLAGDLFLCTYGDGLADIDVAAALEFHRSHGKLATLTGVHPPSRFGELVHTSARVARFAEKPAGGSGLVSGGFFIFDRRVLDRLEFDAGCVLEREPLEGLARDGELMVYEHGGFWQCADTVRDVELLRALWDGGRAPWRIWDDRQGRVASSPRRRRTDLEAAA
jgi:glucose-1-phosphate cytidylyltransferase